MEKGKAGTGKERLREGIRKDRRADTYRKRGWEEDE